MIDYLDKRERREMKSILLITNRDSDNVGDQVIEASDISLVRTVMRNLDVPEDAYEICSYAASLIPKKYIETKNEKLLEKVDRLIKKSDLVIFGGAPLFNYAYQIFYERTALTLEIARKYNKPVLFSAIGIEGYDENNEKCQRLKKTLNFECVKQITTRDGIEYLQQYKESPELVIGKVADPAVFSSEIFDNFKQKKNEKKKKIGIFVIRANGFKDNGIDFSRDDAAELWQQIAARLTEKGYDYEFLTSGHFGDEAFLDWMIREKGVKGTKCIFNINDPETLIGKMSSYDAIVSCRLHPSIIAFSLKIPAVGIVWNEKVRRFYQNIGYKDRMIEAATVDAEQIIDKIEKSIDQGVCRDQKYLMTVYNTLFSGIRNALYCEKNAVISYTYEELKENICLFEGTSEVEKRKKLQRKFRRTYERYNELFAKIENSKAQNGEFELRYNSGTKKEVSAKENPNITKMYKLLTGSSEYISKCKGQNNGKYVPDENAFKYAGQSFAGWKIRVKDTNGTWYWYMKDHTLKDMDSFLKTDGKGRYILSNGKPIPQIPLDVVDVVVLDVVWASNPIVAIVKKIKG